MTILFKKNRFVYLLLLIMFCDKFATNLIAPIYASFVDKIGGNLSIAGSSMAIYLASIGIFSILSGKLAQKYHIEKILLVLGYLLGIFVGFGYLLMNQAIQLYLVQILAGLSAAIVQPAFGGLFSSNLEGKFTSGWGNYFGVVYIAAALASLYSGFISYNYGFSALFYSLIIGEFISLLCSIYIISAKKP